MGGLMDLGHQRHFCHSFYVWQDTGSADISKGQWSKGLGRYSNSADSCWRHATQRDYLTFILHIIHRSTVRSCWQQIYLLRESHCSVSNKNAYSEDSARNLRVKTLHFLV
jgi:hypothetical protein